MIIVLEGADGTGKTTLANELKKVFSGSMYIHATWSKELDTRMLEYHMSILADAYQFIQKCNLPVILDRLWLSEAIYAQVFRQGSKYPKEAAVIDKFIEKIGGINIICLADDLQRHADRFNQLKSDRVEMYQNVTHIAKYYNQIWHNIDVCDNICLSKGYLKDIMLEGGLCRRKNYFRYSIEKEGQDIGRFLSEITYELNKLNPCLSIK